MSLQILLVSLVGSYTSAASVGLLYHRTHAELSRHNQLQNHNDLSGTRYGGFDANYGHVVPAFDFGPVIKIAKAFPFPYTVPVSISHSSKQLNTGNVATYPSLHGDVASLLSPILLQYAFPYHGTNSKQETFPRAHNNAYAVRQNLDFDTPKIGFQSNHHSGYSHDEQYKNPTSQLLDSNGIGDYFGGDHRSLSDYSDFSDYRGLTSSKPFRPSQEYTPPELNNYSHSYANRHH